VLSSRPRGGGVIRSTVAVTTPGTVPLASMMVRRPGSSGGGAGDEDEDAFRLPGVGVGRVARAGERWIESGLVFTSTIGTALDPRNVIREFHRLQETAEVERRPFHTCRHTPASLLLAEGVPMKTVQEVLGHTLLSTTADIYGHLFPEAFQEAADAMERAMAG